MDMSYKVPDYNDVPFTTQKDKKQKMKTVYPTLELRGESALKFLKAHPDLKLGEEMQRDVKLKVVEMRKKEAVEGKHVSDYDNCVSLDVMMMDSKDDEAEMNDEDMPKD